MSEYENQESEAVLDDAALARRMAKEALQKYLKQNAVGKHTPKETLQEHLEYFGIDGPIANAILQRHFENSRDREIGNETFQDLLKQCRDLKNRLDLRNRRYETSLPLPEMELKLVASLGPCQILAVTAPDHQPALEYVLAAKAMADKTLVVEEVSREGSVPTLLVTNHLEMPVLILEGDLLIGGKQNRLSNSSVLIPKKTKMPLPVSCVEHGRWHHKSPRPESTRPEATQTESTHPEAFAPSLDCIAAPVHRELKRAKLSQQPVSVQMKVWDSIENVQQARAYCSETSDHEELLQISRSELEDFLESTHCPDDAVGVAVVVGEDSYALDLFDQAATCRHYWKMKIHSSLMQRGRLTDCEQLFSSEKLEQDIGELQQSRWQVRPERAAGKESRLGSELQTLTDRGSMATALAYEQLPVHLTLLSQH
ncbi:MAG: hypothetical protein QF408_14700 [Pirellulales bacterium]|nr:hypothetical protein [Pirellulales bacterium]